ncbi:MAG: LytTR family DNA-binding domain-containing protein [Saprospiraceae bacterium]|nr:response regulator transcription factor [Lewinellaceae bacterium]
MKNYTCILVDDEPIAMDILQTYLQRLDNLEVKGKFTNPIKAFEALQNHPVDLLFLDIQMPELTGLELLQSLRYKPAVILTTAYREFALEGFEYDVLDYLLKPISFDRFLKAIDKLYSRSSPAHLSEKIQAVQPDETAAHFFVRADRKNVKILLEDILYLESLKDYVKIVTTQGAVLTKETISHFDEMLPPGQFLRTHRSFIVATDKVTALSADGLEVRKQLIPVGRMYKLAVEKVILGK